MGEKWICNICITKLVDLINKIKDLENRFNFILDINSIKYNLGAISEKEKIEKDKEIIEFVNKNASKEIKPIINFLFETECISEETHNNLERHINEISKSKERSVILSEFDNLTLDIFSKVIPDISEKCTKTKEK